MRTFIFIEKNGNGTLILSAENFSDAEERMGEKVAYPIEWRVEDEEGEDEDNYQNLLIN